MLTSPPGFLWAPDFDVEFTRWKWLGRRRRPGTRRFDEFGGFVVRNWWCFVVLSTENVFFEKWLT